MDKDKRTGKTKPEQQPQTISINDAIQELRIGITNVMNHSCLPIELLDLVLENIYLSVHLQASQQAAAMIENKKEEG